MKKFTQDVVEDQIKNYGERNTNHFKDLKITTTLSKKHPEYKGKMLPTLLVG